jgi:RNA polymerase sigma-70 factor, ECF subfamily
MDLRELYVAYHHDILNHIYRLTGSIDAAEDLTQDTFLKALKSLRSKPDSNERGWLYRVSKNLAIDWMRHRDKIQWVSLLESDMDPSGELNPEAIDVRQVLSTLPQSYQRLLISHIIYGYTYREISERMGKSEDAVKMRFLRARRSFEDSWRKQCTSS